VGHVRLTRVYRVSEHADLSGRGGLIASARWHTLGRPIVYTADHAASAVLEVLINLDSRRDLPDEFQLLGIELPELDPATPPTDLDPKNRQLTRAWGNDWLARAETALARVPSVIVPQAWNWLLNPAHPGARQTAIAETWRHPWDERLRGRP